MEVSRFRLIGVLALISALVFVFGTGRAPSEAVPTDSEASSATTPREPASLVAVAESESAVGALEIDAAPPTLADRGIAVPGLPAAVNLSEIDGALVAHSRPNAQQLTVYAGPSEQTPVVWQLAIPDEFGQSRALLVNETQGEWLKVDVPVRPNGSQGWVLRTDVEVRPVVHRLRIDLSDKSVVVWQGDEVVLDTTGAIGRPSDPTPTGSFFVRSIFPWDPNSVYGPWVIPLSAYSETIDQINGGDAVVAIHGTQRNDLLGAEVSLGCIRLDNDVITELAALIEPGTPVEIVP